MDKFTFELFLWAFVMLLSRAARLSSKSSGNVVATVMMMVMMMMMSDLWDYDQ